MNGRLLASTAVLLMLSGLLVPPAWGVLGPAPHGGATTAAAPVPPAAVGSPPVSTGGFTLNLGQADPEAIFCAHNAYFTPTGVIFRVPGPDGITSIYRMTFLGARPVMPRGEMRLPYDSNYFLGENPAGWVTGAPNYAEIVYPSLYDGVDAAFRGAPAGLKYEFRLSPGADLSRIRLRYDGAGLSTDGQRLLIDTAAGRMVDGGLRAYENLGGEVPVAARMTVDAGVAGFRADWDGRSPLVIDPLIYSTYLGGRNDDSAKAVKLDSDGNAYLCGETPSTDFPTTTGAYSTRLAGNYDAFVMKVNLTSGELVYSTFIGGRLYDYPTYGNDRGNGLAVDGLGRVVLVGTTESMDFPSMRDSYDPGYNGQGDAFVLRLGPNGDSLDFSTFLGGYDTDHGNAVALDGSGSIYVAGGTESWDFPVTSGAYDTSFNYDSDVFVTKLEASGKALVYSTYIGGDPYVYTSWDQANAIAVDGAGAAYVTGYTTSPNYPTTAGAYDTTFSSSSDAFATKLAPDGASLAFSTLLGSPSYGNEVGTGIAVDGQNGAIVAGSIQNYGGTSDFPTTNGAFDTVFGGTSEAFLTKFDNDGTDLAFSTFLGGSLGEDAPSVTTDDAGNLIVAGSTYSKDFPTTSDAFDRVNQDNADVFLCKFTPNAAQLLYSTYLGGDAGNDACLAVAADASNNACLVGWTRSDFPVTENAFASKGSGNTDAFLTLVPFPPRPAAPPGLAALGLDRKVSLSWNRTGGERVQGYRIYRGPSAGNLSLLATVGNITGYNDTKVLNGATYHYAVSGYNQQGEGRRASVIALAGRVPDAPRDFLVTGTNAQVLLSWQPPSNTGGPPLLGYRLYKGTAPDALSFYRSFTTELAFRDWQVVNGATYYYNLSAWNVKGENFTDTIPGTPGTQPSAPRNLTASASSDSIELAWAPPAFDGGLPVTSYNVYSGTDPLGLQLADSVPDTAYHDTNITRGTVHYYAVSAVNMMGEGDLSRTVEAPPAGAPPGVPIGLHLEATAGGVRLAWSAPRLNGGIAISAYRIFRGVVAEDLLAIANASGLEYSDRDIQNGTTYYYAVAARNPRGEGPATPPESITPIGPPGAPTGLSAAISDGRLELSWGPPASDGGRPLTGYKVYRGLAPDSLNPLASTIAGSHTDVSAENGHRYYYGVSAVNEAGEGPACPAVQINAAGLGRVPGAPQSVTARAHPGYVELRWIPPADSGGLVLQTFKVYRGSGTQQALLTSTPLPFFYDDSVHDGVTYSYKVSAVNSKGEGPTGAPANATVGSPPGPVVVLKVWRDGGKNRLSWGAPESNGGFGVLRYNIYKGESPSSLKLLGNTTSEEYADDSAGPEIAYYMVAALNQLGQGEGAWAVGAAEPSGLASNAMLDIGLMLAAAALFAAALVVLGMAKQREKGAPKTPTRSAAGPGRESKAAAVAPSEQQSPAAPASPPPVHGAPPAAAKAIPGPETEEE